MQLWQIMNPQSGQCQQNMPLLPQTAQVRSILLLRRRFRFASLILKNYR